MGGGGGSGQKWFVSFTSRLIKYCFFSRNDAFSKSSLTILKLLIAFISVFADIM